MEAIFLRPACYGANIPLNQVITKKTGIDDEVPALIDSD